MPDGRVLIGDGSPLAVAPAWERFDLLSNCRCPGYDLDVGRRSEFEITDTGNAIVYFHDRGRVLDTDDLVGRPILLQMFDPVAGAWREQFRGIIDEPDNEVIVVTPQGQLSNVQLRCVDMFAYLAAVELIPAWHGHPPAAGREGVVFYEDGPVATGTGNPDDGGRIETLFADAGVDPDMFVAFSGNVDVQETAYSAGDSVLVALRDAADAEFPGIANLYCDRKGRIVFHGRFARFDPDGVAAGAGPDAWDFQRWKGGDGAATIADPERAQIRTFAWNRPRQRIYNSAIAWPRGLKPSEMPNQVYLDEDSIDAYGYRAMPPMADLIIKEHKVNGNTGAEECQLFAEFFVENYKLPRKSIHNVTFKSIRPGDRRAAATWELMSRMDISDVLNLTVDAGGVANEDFYVEGRQVTVRALNPDFDYVEVTPNLTPTAYYTDNVFV